MDITFSVTENIEKTDYVADKIAELHANLIAQYLNSLNISAAEKQKLLNEIIRRSEV